MCRPADQEHCLGVECPVRTACDKCGKQLCKPATCREGRELEGHFRQLDRCFCVICWGTKKLEVLETKE